MNEDKQEQLRIILVKYKCEEFGDCIIDEICDLFGYPNTNYKIEKKED